MATYASQPNQTKKNFQRFSCCLLSFPARQLGGASSPMEVDDDNDDMEEEDYEYEDEEEYEYSDEDLGEAVPTEPGFQSTTKMRCLLSSVVANISGSRSNLNRQEIVTSLKQNLGSRTNLRASSSQLNLAIN